MSADFIDANVLVYLASNDAAKADQAEALLTAGGVISVQVLNELANVARRKMGLGWGETRDLLAAVREWLEVRPITPATHDLGVALAERHGLSIHDAMIVAAALEAGCETLWSQDMHNGLVVDGRLRIVDPFRSPTL